MSSKTFKSVVHGSSIQVHDNGEGVFIGLLREDSMTRGTTLSKSDAPALALAVLEAAGVEPDREPLECQVSLGTIVADLQATIKHGEALADAARELAELEAEALELMNVRLDAAGNPKHLTKETVDPIALEAWIAVARRAREMRAEK